MATLLLLFLERVKIESISADALHQQEVTTADISVKV